MVKYEGRFRMWKISRKGRNKEIRLVIRCCRNKKVGDLFIWKCYDGIYDFV